MTNKIHFAEKIYKKLKDIVKITIIEQKKLNKINYVVKKYYGDIFKKYKIDMFKYFKFF